MRVYRFPGTALSIKGNAAAFLNGIASNTLEAPQNAFLNQHGRIIATFRQERISDDEFLICVPPVAVDGLLKHLERYAKLGHVRIEPSPLSTYINLDNGQVIWAADKFSDSISEGDFTLFRLDHNIPLMGIDYQADEFILNVHENDYVSYTKGCFLGQEPVAKVHNRSKPARKLVVAFEDACLAEDAARMTSRAKDASGRTRGFLFVSNKGL